MAFIITPAVTVLLLLCRFLWFRNVARVAALKERAAFALRLDDMCEILRSETSLSLRTHAFRLQDNDVLKYPSAPCGASTADPVLLEAFASVYLVSWIACCNM